MLAHDLDHSLMDFLGDGRAEQGEPATEAGEVGRGLGVIVGEAAVEQVAAQSAFQVAETPAFQVLSRSNAASDRGRCRSDRYESTADGAQPGIGAPTR